nr:hypothetical protein [Tanacetum cinerariifolium]
RLDRGGGGCGVRRRWGYECGAAMAADEDGGGGCCGVAVEVAVVASGGAGCDDGFGGSGVMMWWWRGGDDVDRGGVVVWSTSVVVRSLAEILAGSGDGAGNNIEMKCVYISGSGLIFMG